MGAWMIWAPFNRARDALMIARDGRKVGEMPKEIIGRQPNDDGYVEVRWGRDECAVQLAVKGPPYWRESLPGVDIKIDGYAFPEHVLDWDVQFRTRGEVNDLIRLLRRARDAAFGKDA